MYQDLDLDYCYEVNSDNKDIKKFLSPKKKLGLIKVQGSSVQVKDCTTSNSKYSNLTLRILKI